MLHEECLHPKRLVIVPSVVVAHLRGNFARRQTVAQLWELVQKLNCPAQRSWCEGVNEKRDNDKESEVGLSNVRSTQVSKKQRMALQESDDGINQVGEQNRETKHHKHCAGDISDGQDGSKQQDREEYVYRSAIREWHFLLSTRSR